MRTWRAEALLAELETPKGKQLECSPPDFDTWVSQRPDGGQGFWVWSAPTSNTSGGEILPVAAFAFIVTEDHPLSASIRGRPVVPNIDTHQLDLLLQWDAECEQHHQWCQNNGPMPRRLIDVQSSNSGRHVKIVDLDAEARHRYLALSYATNAALVDRWENKILAADEHVDVRALPKLFQDAIFVTRALRVQYLWIDSLCFPGTAAELTRDSEQFGSVYENAHLTLSATGSKTTADGLLLPRPARSLAQVPYAAPGNSAEQVSVCTLPLARDAIREYYIDMAKQPITSGVWSFQDRVLSRKTVHFASDQMYFEFDALPDGTEYYRKRAEEDTPSSRWFAILWDYGKRQSGSGSGKLAALANVAALYQRMNKDEYIAGHWKQSLLESLCWQSLSCRPSGERGVPSWSWASVDGIPAMGFTSSVAHSFPATILDTRVTLVDDAKPLGDVLAAEISLEAPLVRLKLIETPGVGEDDHMFLRAADDENDERGMYAGFDSIDRRFSQSAHVVRNMPLFAMPVACTRRENCEAGSCHVGMTLRILLVTPVDDVGNRMKRVGYTVSASERLEYEKSDLRRPFVLV
ncbi:Heterokaryon incompatibility [Akanthomyces lecanii RCEF 1005]|uniref:Heterokaryon incompatibility n=1 Tax=Akanthomyces lecanii RCEF 1005 TaxID=1081108 RepID=A0A168H1Z5_CORDF|nr:Heterokaryon incompatibility [Akanthomyces lecanii RCEF 1005]